MRTHLSISHPSRGPHGAGSLAIRPRPLGRVGGVVLAVSGAGAVRRQLAAPELIPKTVRALPLEPVEGRGTQVVTR